VDNVWVGNGVETGVQIVRRASEVTARPATVGGHRRMGRLQRLVWLLLRGSKRDGIGHETWAIGRDVQAHRLNQAVIDVDGIAVGIHLVRTHAAGEHDKASRCEQYRSHTPLRICLLQIPTRQITLALLSFALRHHRLDRPAKPPHILPAMTIVRYDYRPKRPRKAKPAVVFPCGRIVSARPPKKRHYGVHGADAEIPLTNGSVAHQSRFFGGSR
jgi:hypothetical protein